MFAQTSCPKTLPMIAPDCRTALAFPLASEVCDAAFVSKFVCSPEVHHARSKAEEAR